MEWAIFTIISVYTMVLMIIEIVKVNKATKQLTSATQNTSEVKNGNTVAASTQCSGHSAVAMGNHLHGHSIRGMAQEKE